MKKYIKPEVFMVEISFMKIINTSPKAPAPAFSPNMTTNDMDTKLIHVVDVDSIW